MTSRICVTALCLALMSSASFASTAIPGASYDLGFSPGGSSLAVVLKGIDGAKSEILVAAYGFTSKPIAQALLNAAKRGVKVSVIADEKANSRSYSAVTYLANHGVPVRLNGNFAIFHHKFMCIDNANVETGSLNFTEAAVKSNAENALLLSNVPKLASQYKQEWVRLWGESAPLAARY